jgi:hypothetical protein
MKAVHSVFYNDGEEKNNFAIVRSHEENGNLNLLVFGEKEGGVEHKNDVPRGDVAGTYHD